MISSFWNAAVKAAGIELHFHDLRSTAATRLCQAGFTTREVAQFMGWSEDKVERLMERYVHRKAVLTERIRKLDENAAITKSVKPAVKPRGAPGEERA